MSGPERFPGEPGGEGGVYLPGFAPAKLIMAAVGFLIFAFGMAQLWEPLSLLLVGQPAQAEATTVIKAKNGLPEIVLKSDAEIVAQREPRDRSYVFWNEFAFRLPNEEVVNVRANVGSRVGPLFLLTDESGMPTTTRIYYDPQQPQRVVFPRLISVWLAGGVLTLVGVIAMIIGLVLFYWAGRPIEVPVLHVPDEAGSAAEKKADE